MHGRKVSRAAKAKWYVGAWRVRFLGGVGGGMPLKNARDFVREKGTTASRYAAAKGARARLRSECFAVAPAGMRVHMSCDKDWHAIVNRTRQVCLRCLHRPHRHRHRSINEQRNCLHPQSLQQPGASTASNIRRVWQLQRPKCLTKCLSQVPHVTSHTHSLAFCPPPRAPWARCAALALKFRADSLPCSLS